MASRRVFLKTLGITAITMSAGTGRVAAQSPIPFDRVGRINLTPLPTSLNKMENLTEYVGGPDLFIKRDDVMDLAAGGNKTRKLEYSLAAAIESGAKAVVTQGGLQSNHVRQTCSAANKLGLEAHVILNNPVPEMEAELTSSGNYLMNELMGAHIYHAEENRGPLVEKVLADLNSADKRPYNIPAGASNGIGSLGYVNAARELIEQWEARGIQPSHIFTATGSCGTQAGLLTGLRYFGNTHTQVIGISVSNPSDGMRTRVRSVIDMIATEIQLPDGLIKEQDIIVYDEFFGSGYGRPTDEGISAMRLTAEQEGIILDPVYTSKCMSGMLSLLKEDRLDNPRDLVFLHTGGSPAIHPYAEYLSV